MDVRGKKVTVFGMGKSGLATCRLLQERGAEVRAADNADPARLAPAAEELGSLGIPLLGQSGVALEGCKLAVLSPGVPPDLPLFDQARASGIPILGDVEVASWFLRGPILGVTGSNGKTTVTALCGHLLQQCGIPCQVGGNIGTPLAAMVSTSESQKWNVLELSSFQLETSETLRVHVALALNVTPDHLDRHHTFEAYAAAKARIFRNQTAEDYAVLNRENQTAAGYAACTRASVHWFNAGGPVERGFWMEGGQLFADGEPWMPATEIPLRGRHNVENVLAAACAAHLAGAGLPSLRAAVRTFPGVEHRIEFVRRTNGVDYYNDSKATNVDATIKALESFDRGLWVILGGKDKQSDYRPLIPLLQQRAERVLLIGAASPLIASHLGSQVPWVECGDLAGAIEYASARARQGDTVLLAPACASFDQFKDYQERGRVFKQLVSAIPERTMA